MALYIYKEENVIVKIFKNKKKKLESEDKT